MPNYKIEGDINFYDSLYGSLDYDSDKEQGNICEITGQKLINNFVTLECKHTFNYDAIYTEICKQKFEFHSYTSDVLSKTDIQKIRDSKLEYYIKCPYCRHIQFELLPYHEDLPFQKKYGVNTNDPDFKVIKTSFISSTHSNGNYTYTSYGYQFAKGVCCKMNMINGKLVPCWNTYTTPIVAPDGTTKELCPIHVRPEVKAYKLEIKKNALEAKLLEKQKLLEKALAKKALQKQKVLEKALKKPLEKESVPICEAVLKTGLRKGEVCGQKSCGQKSIDDKNLCKRHTK
jgi:hypothetical protein